ncbi:MAG: dual specificity protein phosphatase family protein [Cyanobacteria bacterium P01_F01_bin.13]
MPEPPSPAVLPWWVLPKRLAGFHKPTAEELTVLKANGISAIVSVLSDDSNLDLYKQNTIPHIWVPILGGTAPTLDQLNQIKIFVDSQNSLGNAVVIHCSSGRRRTGTVLAALLINQGSSYKQALNTILNANPAIEMREAQLNFLQTLSHQTLSHQTLSHQTLSHQTLSQTLS